MPWVPCSERLPVPDCLGCRGRKYTKVLVWSHSLHTALFYEDRGFVLPDIQSFDNSEGLHDFLVNGVTHWMPVPSSPFDHEKEAA